MPLIYITGISGSGKSTVMERLKNLGYEVHGIDEEGYADWVNRKTGQIDEFPHEDKNLDLHTWYAEHYWVSSEPRIKQLADEVTAAGKLVFLCGNAGSDHKVLDYFGKVIVLRVDNDTLRHRLATRTTNDYGKHEDELREVLAWHEGLYDKYQRAGATLVDATRSVDEVVGTILASVKERAKGIS